MGNTVPKQVNRSSTPVQAQVRYEQHLCRANVGDIWLGRLLNGSDAGRTVVLRRIRKQWLSKRDAEWVLFGAQAYSQVRNPSLVKLLGMLEQDEELVSVSEHLEGVRLVDLQHVVFDEGVPIPATVAVRIVLDAARATWKAHRLAADVGTFPTERLFLSEGVLITTYGATLLGEIGVLAALSRCVVARTVPGLLAQLSPEEIGVKPTQTTSPEVFSLGVLLWELLANSWLFSRDSDSHTHQEMLLLEIPNLDRIERFGMPVPDTIVEVVRRATERDPARRFASVNDLIHALERLPAHFIATEHQVAEVVRQRAHTLLAASPDPALGRPRSGTFAEVRSTQPSIAPSSASGHDWDRPTFAQSSLVSTAPFPGSVSPVANTRLPSSFSDSSRASTVRTRPPRRRRAGVLSLSLTMLTVALFVITFRGVPEPLRPAFLPAPAAAVVPETTTAIPTALHVAQSSEPQAHSPQPSSTGSAPAAVDESMPTAPQASNSATSESPSTPVSPLPTMADSNATKTREKSAASLKPAVQVHRAAARKPRAARPPKAARDAEQGRSNLDPQWGI